MPENVIPENVGGSSNGADASSQRKEMSYSDYLHLDQILRAQQPLSTAHDEMLFIIQHQTSELWMKLAIHELNATCRLIAADNLQPAFKTLSRVSRILEQLNSAWDVLRTMTPSEYTEFRGLLGQSSGFQSRQYRMIEFLVGNKNAAMIQVHADNEAVAAELAGRPSGAQHLRSDRTVAASPRPRHRQGHPRSRCFRFHTSQATVF